jgi:hypothetical protein
MELRDITAVVFIWMSMKNDLIVMTFLNWFFFKRMSWNGRVFWCISW